MKIVFPDYKNSLVNLSNSILKHYGLGQHHSSLAILDKYLEDDYKNVVVLAFDGMGSSILKKNSDDSLFLNKYKVGDITSVFPSTTTAATASLTSGLTPTEHCWLGWDNYVASIDKIVTMYVNKEKGSKKRLARHNVCEKEFPYVTIMDQINKSGKARAYQVSPFVGKRYKTFAIQQMFDKVAMLCDKPGKKFVYAYAVEPDSSMHKCGTNSEMVKELIEMINFNTEVLSEKLEDSLLIVTADHGHIDVSDYIILDEYPDLKNMLIRDMSLENRAPNFFVKPEEIDNFNTEFNKYFSDDFLLLPKTEVIQKELFGPGNVSNKFLSCLGDYIAIAKTDKAIRDNKKANYLKSQHAGICEDEMLVPLIVKPSTRKRKI